MYRAMRADSSLKIRLADEAGGDRTKIENKNSSSSASQMSKPAAAKETDANVDQPPMPPPSEAPGGKTASSGDLGPGGPPRHDDAHPRL